MSPAEILRAAKAKIEKPESHCRGCAARDADGNEVNLYSAAASSWCSYGAKAFVQFDTYSAQTDATVARHLANAAYGLGYSTVVECNDNADHTTVLAMFDRAIALAEQE